MMALSRSLTVALLALVVCVCVIGVRPVRATRVDDIGRTTLVVLDDLAQRATYSRFFSSLTGRGFKLDFVQAEDDIAFVEWGEFRYDSLIFLAPRVEALGGSLSVEAILDFIDQGHDVILATDSDATWVTRELASSVGVEIDDEGTFVIDHFNFDARDSGSHTLFAASNIAPVKAVVGERKINPVLYRGAGLILNPENQLVFPVLSGSSTCYSATPGDAIEEIKIAGTSTVLVASLQARNNARVTVFGSLDILSDSFATSNVQTASTKFERSGNEEFVTLVTKWTLHERGMLRMRNVVHHLPGEQQHPEMYVINQEIEYTLTIEQFDENKWVPFLADDLQLEFSMLDPYVRVTLSHDDNGNYVTRFRAPDVYGVFTFSLEYHRQGLSNLVDKQRIVVRPLRHDEYERFIVAAYPYYAAAFSMIGSVVLLTVIFLFHHDPKL